MSKEIAEQLNAVQLVLQEARNFGLESEVVVWALDSMKHNPQQSVEQAIISGYNEWIK